jgi:hypothetical protein
MKTKYSLFAIISLLLLAAVEIASANLGTSLTYQGRLNAASGPANGLYDFTFQVFTNLSGGIPNDPPVTNAAVTVSNGLFTAVVDFGGRPENHNDAWLQLGVRTNGGGGFTVLSPRQPITSAPYTWFADLASNAITAVTATTAGSVAPGGVTSSSIAAGSIMASNINLANLSNRLAGDFWSLGGNSGTTPGVNFVGTTDNQPLELWTGNARALRLEPNLNNPPNLIGGAAINYVAPGTVGAVIGGGGGANEFYFGDVLSNSVAGSFGTIGGGVGNTIGLAEEATIGGGAGNTVEYGSSTTTIGGGYVNTIKDNGAWSTISGGGGNTIESWAQSSTIGGGYENSIQFLSGAGAIGGGHRNAIQTNVQQSVIGGGNWNTIQNNANNSIIGGGEENIIQTNADYATVAGGRRNVIGPNATNSAIGGGVGNVILNLAINAVIPGGYSNSVGGSYSLAAGRQASAAHPGAFVWADSSGTSFISSGNNQFLVRAGGGVGINTNNPSGFALHVVGDTRVSGALRLGSETNTASGPAYPAGSTGLVIRRISSTSSTAGTLIARTDTLQLQRDGTASGLQLAYTTASQLQNITGIGITTNGTQVIYRNYLRSPAGSGTLVLFNDSQKIVHYDISFGNVYNSGHTCHVILDRYEDNITSDYFLVGTVTTTYNQ